LWGKYQSQTNKGEFQTPKKNQEKKEKILSPLKESTTHAKHARSTEKIRAIFTNIKEDFSEVDRTSVNSAGDSPKQQLCQQRPLFRMEGKLRRDHASLAEFLISCRKTDRFKVR
jgi:hypothetical protein